VLVAVACAVGCESGPQTLNTALAGKEIVSLQVNYLGLQKDYQIELTIEVNGNSAQVSHVCPNSTGSLTATGYGNSAYWSGTMACPPVVFGNCSSVVMTYTYAGVTFNPPSEPGDVSTLTFVASGMAAGCDLSGLMTANSFGEW